MAAIRNILFDFGNVLIDIDIPRTEASLRALLGEEYDSVKKQLDRRDIFHRYEIGQIGEESFLWAFQHAAKKLMLQPRNLLEAWNSMLLGIPSHRLSFLTDLADSFRLFMFSNTNASHIAWVHHHLRSVHGIGDFEERFFTKVYYSHLIGRAKPEVEAYRYILADADIPGEETLFIDDNEANIHGAADAGLLTLHHHAGAEIAEVLPDFLAKAGNAFTPKTRFIT
jgi:putative hydrolase of the HAD superfamily